MFKTISLFKFYNKEVLNKKNILILFIFLIVLTIFSIYSLNLGFEITMFEYVYKDFLNIYYESVIRLVLILNSILIPVILISDLKLESITLNTMLVKATSPIKLYIAKNLSTIRLVLYLISLEFLIISFIPIYLYPHFKVSDSLFALYLYFLLFSIAIIEIEFLLIHTIKNYFVLAIPIVLVFISFMIDSNATSLFIINFTFDKVFSDYYKELITLSIFDVSIFSFMFFLNDYLFR